jgi:hypothetical protein
MKSSAMVTRAEIRSEPRQPRRFEKKKNMFCSLRRSDAHTNQPTPKSVPDSGRALPPLINREQVCRSAGAPPWRSGRLPLGREHCPTLVSDASLPEFGVVCVDGNAFVRREAFGVVGSRSSDIPTDS